MEKQLWVESVLPLVAKIKHKTASVEVEVRRVGVWAVTKKAVVTYLAPTTRVAEESTVSAVRWTGVSADGVGK